MNVLTLSLLSVSAFVVVPCETVNVSCICVYFSSHAVFCWIGLHVCLPLLAKKIKIILKKYTLHGLTVTYPYNL